MREYGVKAFATNQICLKVAADGRKWNVRLTKTNDGTRVWFHDDGWQMFVEFYSVGLEYFLVFKYERQSSSFYVVIFDRTATEVEYPMKIIICIDDAEEKVKKETNISQGMFLV